MKRNLSGMTAQQAPSPWIARQAPVWSSVTVQIAFQRPHRTRPMSALASTTISNSEMTVEEIDANRLARSHPMLRPATVRRYCGRPGGGRFAGVSITIVMGSSLHQRDARVIPVHEQADAEADGEEHEHDEGDGLDGLAGLVQGRVRDRYDVLVTDRDRQRGVFGQVQILARHRRDDDAQGCLLY